MTLYYRLQLGTDNTLETFDAISDVLGLLPDASLYDSNDGLNKLSIWIYTKEVNETEPYFDFINEFMDLVEPNLSKLQELGIHRSDISIWKLYGYDQQCNMEFDPQRMKRLGDNGITLCISCWEE